MWKLEIMIYSDETIENLYIHQVILFQQLISSERMRLKGKMVRNNIYIQTKYFQSQSCDTAQRSRARYSYPRSQVQFWWFYQTFYKFLQEWRNNHDFPIKLWFNNIIISRSELWCMMSITSFIKFQLEISIYWEIWIFEGGEL